MEKLYCGIDFHKRTSTFCVVKEDGSEVECVSIFSERLVQFFSNRRFEVIGIEASGGTNEVVQKLKNAGHNVKIINPNKFKAIGMGGKKTDKKDARALADALRLNFIPEVHHKSEYARNLKSLIVSREQLVRTRVNFVNHIRGTLREYGITMPQGMEAFWKHVEKCLQEVKNGHIQKSLMDMLEMIGKVEEQETELMQAIKEYVKNDARFERLQTIPGVGPLGGLALMAVIDDCSRFKNSKHFASYLGLVPREHSSGDKRRMGSITRSGSEIVRRYLIHGARAVLLHTKDDTKDPNRAWALRLKGRIGMNKAVVALAHRMARIAFNVLTNETTYTDRPRKTSPDKLKEKAA